MLDKVRAVPLIASTNIGPGDTVSPPTICAGIFPTVCPTSMFVLVPDKVTDLLVVVAPLVVCVVEVPFLILTKSPVLNSEVNRVFVPFTWLDSLSI